MAGVIVGHRIDIRLVAAPLLRGESPIPVHASAGLGNGCGTRDGRAAIGAEVGVDAEAEAADEFFVAAPVLECYCAGAVDAATAGREGALHRVRGA